MNAVLITLQLLQAAILWTHDLVPLGPLNDVKAVRTQDTADRLIRVTLIQSVPYTIGLIFSVQTFGRRVPEWLLWWLWISYGLLFLGELRAWWIPYLFRPEPERASRYRAMFGGTHSFLPERNGIIPNTLHCILHAATLATLLALTATL